MIKKVVSSNGYEQFFCKFMLDLNICKYKKLLTTDH